MFWIGLLIGACVGTFFGVMVIAMCQVAGDADRRAGYKE